MIDGASYLEKFPMTAFVTEDDGKWSFSIKRGRQVVLVSAQTYVSHQAARKSLERITFAIRHNARPIKIIEHEHVQRQQQVQRG